MSSVKRFRALDEGMEHARVRHLLRCQAAELPELRDHVRLVGIPQRGRESRPSSALAGGGEAECRVDRASRQYILGDTPTSS